jgi:hypothetical protein
VRQLQEQVAEVVLLGMELLELDKLVVETEDQMLQLH